MEPAAQQFAKDEGGKVKVVMVDVDTQSTLSSAYGVTGIPHCIFFKNGIETSLQLVGSYDTSAEDESALISLFNELS
jgi:thioredoxin-like negative regulator of GroEL